MVFDSLLLGELRLFRSHPPGYSHYIEKLGWHKSEKLLDCIFKSNKLLFSEEVRFNNQKTKLGFFFFVDIFANLIIRAVATFWVKEPDASGGGKQIQNLLITDCINWNK